MAAPPPAAAVPPAWRRDGQHRHRVTAAAVRGVAGHNRSVGMPFSLRWLPTEDCMYTALFPSPKTLIVLFFFLASQHTLNQLKPQQYTTPTVYVSSKLPSSYSPTLYKSRTLCRPSLYTATRVTCTMVEDYRARA